MMRYPQRLQLFVAFVGLLGAVAAKPLSFSWDTVPVFVETSNVTGPFDNAAVKMIAKAHVFVAEKGYDFPDPGYAEDKIRALGIRLRDINPNISLIYYFNSNLDCPGYRLHAEMAAHSPNWWMRQPNGDIAYAHIDSGRGSRPPFPFTQLNVFNHSVPEVRATWVEDCLNMTQNPPFFDGCMVDRWTRTPVTTPPLSKDVLNQWSSDRDIATQMLVDEMKTRDKYLISGGSYTNQTDGESDPGFGSLNSGTVQGLLQLAKDKRGALLSYKPGSTGAQFESQLAAYLVGCEEGMYFGAGSWTTNHTSREGVTWHAEYDRPLGKPLGPATLTNGEYVRRFAAGVTATFNKTSLVGTIKWA